ncbi:MAG: YIP1 family protein [Candidatus Zixiibacteriota bacterium]|nr:MAG: YIP1 family protein [candidate division Zixibacteria bacterium]
MTQMEPASPVGEPTKSAGLSFKGLIEVFSKPTEFYGKLKNEPKILVPYIVLALTTAVFFHFAVDYLAQLQYEATIESGRPVPPGFTADSLKPFMYIGAVFFLIAPLIYAAVAMFIGNFVLGGETRYKKLLSVMLYGEILFSVGMLLHLPLILAKDSIMVSYSLAAILQNPEPQSLAWVGLSKISVFHIWEIIVTGIGFSAVYDFTRNKGYVLSVITIGGLAAVHVALTAVQAAFN